MFDFQRQVRLKQAENAFQDGRLDEAFAVASEKEIRELRGGQVLLESLVDPLLDRATDHFQGGRLREALLDVERALAAGGNRPRASQLRKEVRDAMEAREAASRREREAITSARAHLVHGSLRTGLAALQGAPASSSEAERLRREVEARERHAAEARARCGIHLDRDDIIEALTALTEATAADPRHVELANLRARTKTLTVEKIEAVLKTGDLRNASDLTTRLARAAGDSLETRRHSDILALAGEAARAYSRADLEVARGAMARLRRELPGVDWVEEACRELEKAITALGVLRAGPLGQTPTPPHPRAPIAPATQTIVGANMKAQFLPYSPSSSPTDSRLLLWVDGVGTYLLFRGDRITLGRAGSSSQADIALSADVAGFHAEILRSEDDYFVVAAQGKVEVGGQGVTRKLLTNGDSIVLGGAAKLLFELPTPLSPSALLTLKNQRIERDVRKVILVKSNLLIGPGEACHVQVPARNSQPGAVVLSLDETGIVCRAEGELLLDGKPAGRETPVPLGAHVQFGEVTFTITGSAGSHNT